MEKLSPGWASWAQGAGKHQEPQRAECEVPARHGQHAGLPARKTPPTPQHPKLRLHLRASNTATPGISARRLQRRAGPGTASRRGRRGWPRSGPFPPLSTRAQSGAGTLPRSRAGQGALAGIAGPGAGGHYLSDGVSEEEDAGPAQEPPAGARLRQRHGRGRTSAGSRRRRPRRFFCSGKRGGPGNAAVTKRLQAAALLSPLPL